MRLFLLAGLMCAGVSGALLAAEGSPAQNLIYGNVYYHFEKRDGVSMSNPEFFLGYDRLINSESQMYVGGRFGILREQVLTSIPVGTPNSKVFLGGHGYKLLGLAEGLKLKAGVAADLVKGDDRDPLYLYIGGETGLRWQFTEEFYVELPVEIGLFPFFDGIPVFGKVGVQLGLGI